MSPPPPSGRQLSLQLGENSAVVTEVGATLRQLMVGGEAVLWAFGADEIAHDGRGQVLAPWPNRLEDGAYTFGGRQAAAALDEPERSNAIHGLVRWLGWSVDRLLPSSVELSVVLHPQPAYPWRLVLRLTYSLTDLGILVGCDVENVSDEPAPFGIGFHPYLVAGDGGADRAELRLRAAERLVLDERALPIGRESTAKTRNDFTAGKELAGVVLDDCFTSLVPESDEGPVGARGAVWRGVLRSMDGNRQVSVWAEDAFGYAMVYTGDTLAEADRRRAVAIEPMTCPPNALRTGEGLIVLPPGGRWSSRWGIEAR